jgi:hypothetical protein
MANDILCYGIISKVGIVQVEKIDFKDLGKPGYDYQVVFKTISEGGGNGVFDLEIVQDGEELEVIEMKGWKFTNFKHQYCWGSQDISADMIDINGDKISAKLSLGHSPSPMAPYGETKDEMLKKAFQEMIRITKTYDTVGVYNLCEEYFYIRGYVERLSDYYSQLDKMSEYCKRVNAVLEKIRESPQSERDRKAFEDTIKRKVNHYIKDLTSIGFSQTFLSI